MICTCGHHMGAHRPFCRDCEFNTAGCRDFRFSMEKTLDRMSSKPVTAEEQGRRRRELFNRERDWQRMGFR